MNQLLTLLRLAGMRRSTGASRLHSITWAAGLLWRNHVNAPRRHQIDRRAEVERTARGRL